ncbi:MAG: hypothetical protein WCD86_01870 [Ktedonobacteraceae bacterium]
MNEQVGRQHMPRPCSQWAERLAARHPSDLTSDEQRALRDHIAGCPACAAVLAEYRTLDSAILALPAVEPLPFASVESIARAPIIATMNSQDMPPVTRARWARHTDAPTRRAALARFASLAAAVLLVGAIVGSLLLVMAAHHSQTGNNVGQNPVANATAKDISKKAVECPPDGTARAAIMPPLTTIHNHDNLVYVDNEQSAPSPKATEALLMRYDTVTQQKIMILKLVQATIINAEVSPDGQWVMDVSRSDVNMYAVQIVRVDGKYLQTLVCSQQEFMDVSWSPDQQWIAINQLLVTPNGKAPGATSSDSYRFGLLRLATGQFHTTDLTGVTGSISPDVSMWLDNSHLLVERETSTSAPNYMTTLYSLDITLWLKGQQRSTQQLTGSLSGAVDVASDGDGAPLYISQCNGSPQDVMPPCSISEQSIQGGTPQVIYKTTNLAIDGIRAYGKGGLLVMVYNVQGDTSQNGVWELYGTNLTRLFPTTASAPTSFNPFTADPWANVSRDGRWYALKIETGDSDTLAIGSMNGGPLTTIDTRGQANWSISGAAGWTTM